MVKKVTIIDLSGEDYEEETTTEPTTEAPTTTERPTTTMAHLSKALVKKIKNKKRTK